MSKPIDYQTLYELVDGRTDKILNSFESWKKNDFYPLLERVDVLENKVEKMGVYVGVAVGIGTLIAQLLVGKGVELVGNLLAQL